MDNQFLCAFCETPLKDKVIDFGVSPLANSYLTTADLEQFKEPMYPLNVFVCHQCLLTQLGYKVDPERIFTHYAYLSSCSETWQQHVNAYVDQMIREYKIDDDWHVVEIGSNDGTLLKYFKDKSIPVLGVEPAKNIAQLAIENGIETMVRFFNQETAKVLINQKYKADLLIGNNVLAHIPDINGLMKAIKLVLNKNGFATFEFPHILTLFKNKEFDTIYHEHYFYYSILSLQTIFYQYELMIFKVEKLLEHGGSLRIYVKHNICKDYPIDNSIDKILKEEKQFGLEDIKTYTDFSDTVVQIKQPLVEFLTREKAKGKIIVGYGAPAKGNTLLWSCEIGKKLLSYTVDKNPLKQNKFLPGTHIPIYSPEKIKETKPDYVLILPWNIKKEIQDNLVYIKEWGGKFIAAVPKFEVI